MWLSGRIRKGKSSAIQHHYMPLHLKTETHQYQIKHYKFWKWFIQLQFKYLSEVLSPLYFQNDLTWALLNLSKWGNCEQLWWKTVGWKEIFELAPTKRGDLGWFEVTICGIMKIMFATSSLFTKLHLSTLPRAYTMRWQLWNKVQLVYRANTKHQSRTQYLTNVTAVWRSVKASGYRSYAEFNCLPKLNRESADGKR